MRVAILALGILVAWPGGREASAAPLPAAGPARAVCQAESGKKLEAPPPPPQKKRAPKRKAAPKTGAKVPPKPPPPKAAAPKAPARPRARVPDYVIIVNREIPVSSLDQRTLADMFLKRSKFWPNGEPVRPVDLRPRSAARRAFSDAILHRPVSSVRTYWQQRIFTGRDVPPPEFNTDAAVIAYVRDTPGAIGYVSGGARTGSVKVLKIR